MASVRSIDDALSITLTDNGRIMRNLIHGADTVMSHILHFYHLSAADFVDISPVNGVLGSPWDDGDGGAAFGSTSSITMATLLTANPLNAGATHELAESYVRALNVRKDCHTMGAIFSGRQPIQNAIVPGGVSTIFTQSDIDTFRTKLQGVRNFINAFYIPDVVFVATRSTLGWTAYWGVGTNPGKLLSYGDYPANSSANIPFPQVTNSNMLIARGLANYVDATTAPTFETFDINNIKEYVDHSFYSSADGLHPSSGATTPLAGTDLSGALAGTGTYANSYSWLKAPRYGAGTAGVAAEVGPLARMVVSHLAANGLQATENGGSNSLTTYLGAGLANPYTVTQLVTYAIGGVNAHAGAGTASVPKLFSPLGRHAARALEAKLVADAMYTWLDQLTLNNGITTNTLGDAYTTAGATGSGYTYVKIPSHNVAGAGLAEAPRGALGHWISIQSKKVANYQCVVPSTWNACPQGNGVKGPAESVLMGLPAATSGAFDNDAIVNIARMLHPYDFCIACAVHVVTPDGKDIAKFEMGLDGKTKKLPLDSK